jgi:hypothetical protein
VTYFFCWKNLWNIQAWHWHDSGGRGEEFGSWSLTKDVVGIFICSKSNNFFILQSKGSKWGQALTCLKVEYKHGHHGKSGVLDLSKLQPLQLG